MRRDRRARQVGGAVAFLKQRNRLINVLRENENRERGAFFQSFLSICQSICLEPVLITSSLTYSLTFKKALLNERSARLFDEQSKKRLRNGFRTWAVAGETMAEVGVGTSWCSISFSTCFRRQACVCN
eukprot:COSAG06_NODE_1909_length_8084_cov_66.552536_6_plen_128_part_00